MWYNFYRFLGYSALCTEREAEIGNRPVMV